MSNKTLNSLLKILLCCTIFTICAMTNANVSQAVANDFTELVKSPSITIAKPSTTKLEAIKVTIKAPSTTKIKENKFYINNKEITLKPASNNNNSEMVYQISKNSLPKKNKTQTIKVLSTANNSQIIYKVVNVTNKNGKYYALSNSPSITDIKYTSNKVVISMKSTGEKINAVEVLDTNNNKMVYSNKKLADKTTEVKIAKGKLNLKNDGYYRIKISVSDKNGAYTVKNIAFKLPAEATANNTTVNVKDSDMTVTNIPCPHKDVSYKITTTGHTGTCKSCKKTVKTGNHVFNPSTGKCKVCGYECKHSETRYIIKEDTHQKVCVTCGKAWKEEKHNISNNKCTVCKADNKDKLAKVTTNESPEIKMKSNGDKLADVTVTMTSSKKMTNVKIYEVNAKGGNKKELKLNAKTNKNTEKTYVLSDKNLLKGTTHYFYITAKNEYGITTKYYRVKKATNTKRVEYYAIDSAPRMTIGTTTFNGKLQLEMKDGSGLGYLKVYDVNNNNKLMKASNNLMTTRGFLQVDLDKYKSSKGTYKLKFEMRDAGSTALKLTTKVVEIKLADTKLNIPTTTGGSSTVSTPASSTSTSGSSTGSSAPIGSTKVVENGNAEKGHKHSYYITGEYLDYGSLQTHYSYYKCSCGQKIAKIYSHQWDNGYCKLCNKSQGIVEQRKTCEHNHTYAVYYRDDDDSEDHAFHTFCSSCQKYLRGGFASHSWTQVGNAYKYCSKCGYTTKIK